LVIGYEETFITDHPLVTHHTGFGIRHLVKKNVGTIHELSLQGFLDTISGIILILGVFMAVMSILPKSNDQLIADGKAKSGH
jgi:hypothetical protein